MKSVTEDRDAAFGGAAPFAQKGDFAGALRAALDGVHDKPGFFDSLPHAIRTMCSDNVRTMPLSAAPLITPADLRAIAIPVEICFGSDTRSFFKTIARTAAELLPAAKARSVEGAFHLWPALEDQGFSSLLREFLDSTRD
ncbi:MAG: hypothetical protein HOI95_07240 [Chromatiales bacterium]|nr:hypothetical protein [Chromatiales bacterium]